MTTAEQLDRLARTGHLLVALDFDGTLAPLADEPMAARMLPESRAALNALAALPETTVAFVSGRTLHDLRIVTEETPASVFLLAGSHGAEFGDDEPAVGADADATRLRDDLIAATGAAVDGIDGAWIEPKAFGLGLHTRLATRADADAAAEAVGAIVADRAPDWRRRDGHDILEYAFRHEGKDGAVATMRERVGATAVLFAGDDVTDEDALRSLAPGDLGVHVGEGPTAASVQVPDAAALAVLLADLAERRAAVRTH
ncbi:trehalose-phosphatase [Microbacterium sp. cx-59]|uniref:trehalose-phosphatase n=1 Tax=Microbacterium sp. cx-59 TaxID=2891207 RepID=UPI001E29DA74|nr:trehalose-phosphatase [Microbacterium sp. cx-59]MCC4907047.1 trehalose-phosphatase [Microbacterium sp. cx-59]